MHTGRNHDRWSATPDCGAAGNRIDTREMIDPDCPRSNKRHAGLLSIKLDEAAMQENFNTH